MSDWKCSSCDQFVDRKTPPADYGGPDFCPECRDIDTLIHVDDLEDDYDPTPWCHVCGSMSSKNCNCGKVADND